MNALLATVRRDILLALRRKSEVLTALFFFVIVCSLFPLGIGPEPALLRKIAPGVLWVAALLAAILPLDRLIEPDMEAGFFDQWALRGLAEEAVLAVRILAHWLSFAPPLMLAALPAGGEQGALGSAVRIAEFDAHQEAVKLRFGERKGADLVGRVLGGDDEKGARQITGLTFSRNLAFLHGFEQRALGFGGGAVDLVGQYQLGENRAGQEAELALVAVEDRNAGDVGRQQVAGELDARELQAKQASQRMGQGSLAHTGQILDQQVSVGQQAGNRQADLGVLAEDDLAGLLE